MTEPRLKPRLAYTFARDNLVLLEPDEAGWRLWWCESTPTTALSEVRRVHGRSICSSRMVEVSSVQDKIQAAYAEQTSVLDGSAFSAVTELESTADLSRLLQEMPAVEDLLESVDDAPIIRMLNLLLTHAARDRASDIHIEPYERHSSVRFRVDGVLRDVVQPNRALHAALISRLKIMAQLDIAEKRLPQDGRISLRLGSHAVDVRVSTIPNAHGERAVLRLLDKSKTLLTLEDMGMRGQVLEQMEQLIAQPNGILLVTGPTGSGKTTTLYAALQRLDLKQHNIMTVEDPIEYELAGVGQMQVNPKIDLTFAKALRAILRQDPDTIMIGEIRDYETAQIAIQASLTGHLVLATLHTNDAASAINRLVDMGVEPFLLSSSLLGVLAQRLVRKLCVSCGGSGCTACNASGYSGRAGIFELLVNTPEIRQHIYERADEAQVRATAVAQGMTLLREDAQYLIDANVTSLAEVLHVTRH
jgi:general secretion pathway protein E